jgi:hypothetical protein
VFGVAMTGLSVVFLAGWWSRLRYGFFDLFCFVVAFLFAVFVPPVVSRYVPLLEEVGGAPLDLGGALLGCLIYDQLFSGRVWR